MTWSRLSLDAPDLVDDLESLDENQLKEIALAIVEWVMAAFSFDDNRLASALVALRHGERPTAEVRDGVNALVEELDTIAWDVQHRLAESDSQEEYDRAFCRARAVNAIWYASEEPIAEMVLDCAYEAENAREDVDGLRHLVRSLIA